MIWTIIGENNKARSELGKIRRALKKKQPDAEELYFDNEAFTISLLEEAIESAGLFVSKNIVVLDNVIKDAESKELILERLSRMKSSEHAFVFCLPDIDEKTMPELKKYSFDLKDFREVATRRNDFAYADAIGSRDGKLLWELYTKAITEGVRVEELHGQLVWQVKSMILATKAKSSDEVGMNEYPYSKAKRYAKNYSTEELETLLFNLVSIYHEAHRGGIELEVALEKLILELK